MIAEAQSGCPECDGTITAKDGETVCQSCGLVVAEQAIDHGPEWRSFQDDETDSRRTGPARTERRHDHGIGSQIGYDAASIESRQLRRIRKLDEQSKRYEKKDQNKSYLLGQVKRICSKIGISDAALDRCCRVARVGHDNEVAVGETLDVFAGAAVVAGARDHGHPVSVAHVHSHVDGSHDDLYRVLKKTWRATNAEGAPLTPIEYLPQIASRVDARSEIEDHARQILLEAQRDELHVGRKPSGVAGGALYAAGRTSDIRLTQERAADAADVAIVTVRHRYRDLVDAGIVDDPFREVTDGE